MSLQQADVLTVLFRELFGDEIEITETTTAADVDGWDSLAHINLMFLIEQEYGIEFEGDEFSTFTNVGELRTAIEHKITP